MASTSTLQEALFLVAEAVGETRSAFIKTVTSQTSLIVPGISLGQTQTFKYSLARSVGKGVRQVTSYNDASQTVGLASAFDSNVAAGDHIDLAWWDADKMGMAIAAINDSVRASWPNFYREVKTRDALTGTVAITGTTAVTGTSTRFLDELTVGDVIKIGSESKTISSITSQTAAVVSSAFTATSSGSTCYHASGLTFTTQVHVYALPSSVHDLLAVGWALSSSDPVMWIPPLSTWRVTGTEGAYQLHFEAGSTWATSAGSVSVGYANPVARGGTLGDIYNGYEMHLHYASKEPEYTSMTDVTNLPLHYFDVAAETYVLRRLAMLDVDSTESKKLNSVYPMLVDRAQRARAWLRSSRPYLSELKGPEILLR